MDTRSRIKRNIWPASSTSTISSEEGESDIDTVDACRMKSNGVVSNGHGKCRLSLVGTAVLERENEPVLSATYQYWTDEASHFFHDSVHDFRRIELSKVSFGLNGYKQRKSSSPKLNDGIIYQSAESNSKEIYSPSCSQTDYMWSQVAATAETTTRRRNWLGVCNTFAIGFITCMALVAGYHVLTITYY